MTNEKNVPETPQFKWAKPKEAKPQIYTNFVHASWTLFDVRFQLGQLVPVDPGQSKEFIVEEQGAVTVPWPHAKNLRDLLTALIDSYEKTNGEIKTLKLTPAPESAPKPKATEPTQPAKPLSR